MDDPDVEIRKRAEAAEALLAVLIEQLRAAEQRDVEAREQNRELQAQIRQLTALVDGMQKQLARALTDLAVLREQLDKRKRKKGDEDPAPGADHAPPTDDAGSESAADEAPPAPPDDAKAAGTDKKKPKRPPSLPPHLPRQVVQIGVTSCGACASDDLTPVGGGEISEKYHYVPAQVVVERTERATVRCRQCGAFTTAPMPPTPVPGGSMTAAMYAHIAYSKCCMHVTLDAIAADLRRIGVDLAESTLCDAMGHIATLLEPVHEGILDDIFAEGLVHLDGTGVKVLMPGEIGSYRGQFTVLSNNRGTAYFFSKTKEGEHIASFLRMGTDRAYKGDLVADAASNMNLLYADGTIIECGCWQHARDKYEEARSSAPREAAEGIAWIGALFQVEHEADRAHDSDEQRLARRKRDSVPILDGYQRWMAKTQRRFSPDEDLWKAIQYSKNHWTPLGRAMTKGRIPLTNNQAERDLGPIGRGRKSWLFAGSARGGERLATIYTVIGTCLRIGVDPRQYLTEVLPRLSAMPVNRVRGLLATLLPKAWKAAREGEPATASAPT